MKYRKAWAAGLVALLGSVFIPGPASAHDPRPVVVTITESLPGVFRASLRVPMTVDAGNMPGLVWPTTCEPLQEGLSANSRSVRCPEGLNGQSIALQYPAFNPSLATFYQFTDRSGQTQTAMVPPTENGWTVPSQAGGGAVAVQYLVLGIEHILLGPDHLLFVLGLLVIAGTTRRILWTITGFTLAHSITLSLSTVGLISVPIVPVEAGIALSILFLAVEIGQRSHDTITYRYPLIVAFVFGLLHGLGFASALREVGLAPGELVISLLFFNVGVELGQIAFIVAVVVTIRLLGRFVRANALESRRRMLWRSERDAMYVVGIPSAYWLIDRLSFVYT